MKTQGLALSVDAYGGSPRPAAAYAGNPDPGGVVPVSKREWRRRMQRRLQGIANDALAVAAHRIAVRLESLSVWRAARRIGVYRHMADEVPTADLISAIRQRGGDVFLPVYDPRSAAYVPAAWHATDSFQPGPHGLQQPVSPRWSAAIRLDLVLVPGRAFTRDGERLGRGGGHYDRFLSGPWSASAAFIGLALECQLIEAAIWESHDIAMDWVVTESGIYGSSDDAGEDDADTNKHVTTGSAAGQPPERRYP